MVMNARAYTTARSSLINNAHRFVHTLKEKDQSDQRRDDVLHRMLRTPPKPKIGEKSLKNLDKNRGDVGLPPKPLNKLRESVSKSDSIPVDDAEALLEWGKRNIQRND